MNKLDTSFTRFALILALAACSRVESPKPTPATGRYRLAADGATLPLLRALTDAYVESVNAYVIFTLESGNPNFVEERLRSGQVQLGATSLLPPSEPANMQWWVADLAMDGVAVIVHQQNPVNELSLRDVRDIFAGIRNNWTDYGADGIGNIEVAVREDHDGSRIEFDRAVMGDQQLTLDALVMPSIETMLNYVALKPGGIGYVPSARLAKRNVPAALLGGAGRQPVVKAVVIDGKAPTAENVGNGNYPLSRTLNLIAPREPQGELRNFVAWALGSQGKQIAQSLGYAVIQ